MEKWEKSLCETKNILDEPFKNKLYGKTTYLFESFNCEKKKIVSLSNNFNITNAWMKAWELIDHFDLMPWKDVVHFDNASYPGSFILAAHHYATTHEKKYSWYASSLSTDTKEVKNHLEDKYDLRKNYPDKWLMSSTNDGDVSNPENIVNFQYQIPQVDLYTSDLGFDVSQDYNAQERLHLTAHYGQLLSGLMVLKPGANLLVKQFTFFQEVNICNIAIMTQFFDEVYISKPATSKPDNSEVYLVGKNFHISSHDIIPKMLSVLGEAFHSKTQPKVLYGFDGAFGKVLEEVMEKLVFRQMDKIKLNVKSFSLILRKIKDRNMNPYVLARDMFKDQREKDLKEWYSQYQIRKISPGRRLKMKDCFGQLKTRSHAGNRYRRPRKTL